MRYDAMIIIDMQEALVAEHPYHEEEVISNIQRLSAQCRKSGVPVIYVRHDGGIGDELEYGTEGWQICKAIAPLENETIIDKKRNSAFRDTGLHRHLQNIHAENIIMCGMQTEYCFDVSCKVAFEYHYNVTVPRDTTTTFDNEFSTAEKLVRYYEDKIWNNRYARVTAVDEIVEGLEKEQSEKKLGFGLMRLPLLDENDATSIDIEQMKQMVDAFIENGFTYFDTAWMYCGFHSENAAKEALVDRHPRDSYTLATKLHAGFIKTKEDRDRIFHEQRKKTGVEYFDYYLLHDLREEHYKIYNELDCFHWILEKKQQGLVKNIGFSFHDKAELLDKVLTEHPEMDFVQLQINYLDWDSEAVQSWKCYEVATKHGKPVIVMEPVKGGALAKVPDSVEKMFKAYHPEMSAPSWAVRFAASLNNVKMVLSGMSNMQQLNDNMSYMSELVPLNEEEQEIIGKAVTMINGNITIPCTGCSYCTDGCPKKIAIPKYFSLYNTSKQKTEEKDRTPQTEEYNRLTETFGKAGDCIGCGQCEQVCPQHLPIIEQLKEVADYYR